MPERRAEKSRGPCTIDGADAAGAIGLVPVNTVMGAGFADAMWVQVVHSTRLPSKFAGAGVLGVASLGSGLTRAGAADVWTAGVQFVGARIVEVCARGAVGSVGKAGVRARGATSPSSGVTAGSGRARCFNAVT